MAEEKIYVGSFNTPAPTGQTFASFADSTQFMNAVKHLVDDRESIGQHWHDAGDAFQKAMDKIKAITDGLNEVLRDLDSKFEGKAGDRFQDKVDDLRRHNVKVFDNLEGYPGAVGHVGHDIKIFGGEIIDATGSSATS